jgi:predicted RNA-binding Zn-ribbon protein involved in translation (DUF1610 family)
MSLKESYIGILLFFVLSPALALAAPGLSTYSVIAGLAVIYALIVFRKPRRRCVPCGEIVTLDLVGYVKARTGNLECPQCGTTIKNSHRV